MIGDFSVRGEADLKINDYTSFLDHLDFDEVGEIPVAMHNSLVSLIKSILTKFPEIKYLGGHREYAEKLGQNRTCPGKFGIEEVNKLRSLLSLSEPL
ncbi:hypothetical protein [Aliivibrio fischeri]